MAQNNGSIIVKPHGHRPLAQRYFFCWSMASQSSMAGRESRGHIFTLSMNKPRKSHPSAAKRGFWPYQR